MVEDPNKLRDELRQAFLLFDREGRYFLQNLIDKKHFSASTTQKADVTKDRKSFPGFFFVRYKSTFPTIRTFFSRPLDLKVLYEYIQF